MDTNSNWLAKQVNALGWTVQRITVVRDSLKAIREGVAEALERKPEILFTVGGLGPTHDDMTLRGLSIAIGKPLMLNSDALDAIKKKYNRIERRTSLTRHRKKMAMLPRGAEALPNPVGTAPGIVVATRNTTIVSLPGVPSEMKAIFNASVIPIMRMSGVSPPREAFVMLLGIVESALAPVLERAQRRFSNLYFKSHPRGRESGLRSLIRVHVYTVGKGNDGAVRDGVAFLVRRLAVIRSRI